MHVSGSVFLVPLFICVGFLLHFPQCSHQMCTDGTPKQCQEAELAPGSNLAGEGFDITKMQRKGAFVLDMNQWKRKDRTCMLCTNPYMENAKQKLPLAVLDWRAQQSCSSKVTSQLHSSSESLLSTSTSSVENNWKAGLEVTVKDKSGSLILAGTDSKLSQYSMEKTKNDKFHFATTGMSCEYYSYRVSSTHKRHRDFNKAVKKLPKVYSPQYKGRFYKLIETFGTHYLTKVKLGGKIQSVTSVRQCEASLMGLNTQEVQMCLEAEATVNIKATVNAEMKHCKSDVQSLENKNSFSDRFSDRFTEIQGGHTTEPDLMFSAKKDPSAYKEWLNSIPKLPDLISYSLEPVHESLPVNDIARNNLRMAISHYILEKGLWRNCSERCQVGIKSNPRDSCVCQCHNQPAVNADCCPTRKGMARVIITVERAEGLWGDHTTATDGYVKVTVGKDMVHRTRVIDNSNNPHWNSIVDLGTRDISSMNTVRFEVWDEDSKWDDDLLGECQRHLTSGVKRDVCALQHGRFFFRWEVKCAPSLSGPSCTEYKASPMSASLMSLYVSRHSHRTPESILLKKGVFLGDGGRPLNQSLSLRDLL